MTTQPINVEYWSSLYQTYEEDNAEYLEALKESDLVDRAGRLWKWKDLSRSIDFDEIAPVIKGIEGDQYLELPPEKAVVELSAYLRENGAIKGRSLVTPAFLLHLAASSPDSSSAVFPIYDRRVWNAYVYFQMRDHRERLFTAASQSPKRYGDFCRYFRNTCPDSNPRLYEQALFMFGGYIMNLGSEEGTPSIAAVDSVLQKQEENLRKSYDDYGFSMVDFDNIERST